MIGNVKLLTQCPNARQIEWLGKSHINRNGDQLKRVGIKTAQLGQGTQKRQRVLMNKEAWLLENLRRSLDGQMFETPRCVVRFKQNPKSVTFTDEKACMAWAIENHQDVIKYADPVLSKSALKTLIEEGTEVPGAEITQSVRMEVK